MHKNIAYLLVSINRIFAFLIVKKVKVPYNIDILKIIKKYTLLDVINESNDYCKFKDDILNIGSLDNDAKTFLKSALNFDTTSVNTDNVDEIRRYLPIISETISEICKQININNLNNAYDLIDAIHCLPEALLEKKVWNPKDYWDIYINAYRKKWNSQFLSNEEHELLNIQ
jgi:hypothetical protein